MTAFLKTVKVDPASGQRGGEIYINRDEIAVMEVSPGSGGYVVKITISGGREIFVPGPMDGIISAIDLRPPEEWT